MEQKQSHEEEHCVKCLINKNIEEETSAITHYYELLDKDELKEEDRKKIIELIADEKNHQLVLQAMARNYDGGIEATKDNRKEAIDELTSKKPKEEPKEKDDDRKDLDMDDEVELIFLDSFDGGKKGKK